MIGLDTNVLVRYFAQDDARQSALANRTIAALGKDAPGFVSLVVLCELVWVLEDVYATPRAAIIDILRTLLVSDDIVIDAKVLAWRAFRRYEQGEPDFSDTLIAEIGAEAGCHHTLTFDKAAAKSAGFQLLSA